MQWMELTSEQMRDAVEECEGVCLVPMGCLERHGSQLPLGTDQITADAVAKAAAEQEPGVVFPSYYFSKIFTARHYKGTFALTRKLLLPLIEATMDEIARNGFGKIFILNGHGGNRSLLHFFLRTLLDEPRDYVVYTTNYYELEAAPRQQWHEMRSSDYGGHADEMETSMMLHMRPELVHMDRLTSVEDGLSRNRLRHLPNIESSVGWYGEHPSHYAGDARGATAEKGEFLFNACVEKVVRQMRAIKSDTACAELQAEFYRRSQEPE
jgi:creatinine amidohydrolase